MSTATRSLRDVARMGLDHGLCVVPPAEDSSKRPLKAWKRYQTQLPTVAELADWYGKGARTGLGLVCGSASGGLELFEFDDEATYHQFKAAAVEAGLGDLVERVEAGYLEVTPGGGYHLLYFADEVRGNTKLAERPDPADPRKRHVLIETRGEGGYCIVAPTNGKVHPSGGAYKLLRGSLASIVTLSAAERDALWTLARTFDELPDAPHDESRVASSNGSGHAAETRPGDDFDARASWDDILVPEGWVKIFSRAGITYWRRPGKDGPGISATTGRTGKDRLNVYSTSTAFEAVTGSSRRTYSKFEACALLHHRGDLSAAARALAERGYGTYFDRATGQVRPNPRPRGSSPAKAEHRSAPRDERPDTAEASALAALTPSQLYERHPRLREPIIDGLLRRTEIMNLIAPSKAGMSWLSLGLLFSVAAGRPWLDRFEVRPGRVLLIDNELHPETIASRMRWVAQSMGLEVAEYEDNVEVLPLRGNIRDLVSMGGYFESIAGRFDLVVLDSGYRFTTPEDDENSNANTTARYNLLDRYAAACGAAFTYIHHASKGSQADKAVTDVGAGAGAQSRAVDTHMVLLNDPTLGPGRLMVDAAIRSFPPLDPFAIRREGALWIAEAEAAVRPEEREKAAREARTAARLQEAEEKAEAALLVNVGKVVEAIRLVAKSGELVTLSQIADQANLSRDKARAALARATKEGRVEKSTVDVPPGRKGPRQVETYRVVSTRAGAK